MPLIIFKKIHDGDDIRNQCSQRNFLAILVYAFYVDKQY